MECSTEVPWLLAERALPSGLAFPQDCTQRIKYTCFDVSTSFLIFGATSGGLYIFNREPCLFVQLVPNKEGSITKIKISPDEKCIAFATHKGTVCICDFGTATGTYMKSSIIQTSKEHIGNEVTFMIWSENSIELYAGDDVGVVSVINLSRSITRLHMAPTFSLMRLDSRIIQLDIKENLLLVSTFTRCYICDTIKEHYAQIGVQLRDGEYGACFFYESNDRAINSISGAHDQKLNKVNKTFSIVSSEDQWNNLEKMDHLKIFCARSNSRIWEAKPNGTVILTHQFKDLIVTPPSDIITVDDFENDNYDFSNSELLNQKTLNFTKIFMLRNRYLFTFTKECIYIFDPKVAGLIFWTDKYSDIVDCKIMHDSIYIWRSNGSLSLLSFYTIEKFLLKCYMNEKYKLCAQICSNHAEVLIQSIPLSQKLHLIYELGDKLIEINENELHDKIKPLLEEISKIKKTCGQKLKSGIVVVENSFLAKVASTDDEKTYMNLTSSDVSNQSNGDEHETSIFQKPPDAIKVIKGLSNTFSDKLSVGTSKLMQTWNNLEDKVKKITSDKMYNEPLNVRTDTVDIPVVSNTVVINNDDDIVYTEKRSGVTVKNKTNRIYEETDSNISVAVKTIYHNIKLSDINKMDCSKTLYTTLTDVACDIDAVYQIMKNVEEYAILQGNSPKYSNYHCGKVFLMYISKTPNLNDSIDSVIADEKICAYFLQAFANMNSGSKLMKSCHCGYPLPSSYSSQTPQFSNVLDIFIEKLWNASQSEQCYDVCKKVPYMWRKILVLRKNEDLLNLLLLILQMLDEELLYTYLPQFTVDTWKIAIELLATLKKQECLNCGKKFDVQILNKSMLNWDSIASLMLKTIGWVNTSDLLNTYSNLVPTADLSMKYFHSCLFLKMFEKYDGTINNKLIDTVYDSYNFNDALLEMSGHLARSTVTDLPHTALPLVAASKTLNWGLKICQNDNVETPDDLNSHQPDILQNLIGDHFDMSIYNRNNNKHYQVGMSLEQTLEYLDDLCPNKDCYHCCLPLSSRVLVADGGLWVFSCGHTFHGLCLSVLKIKLCPVCFKTK